MEKISAGVDFELPQVLVDSEVDYAIENIKQNLIRSGSNLEKAGISEEKIRKDFKPASEKHVKEMLVLGEIARQEKITVEEDDLSEGYKDLAATMGQDTETLRKYYEARNLVDSLKEKLLEEKTLNYLVEHANITEVAKIEKVEDNNKKEKD
jgi:trigger factor